MMLKERIHQIFRYLFFQDLKNLIKKLIMIHKLLHLIINQVNIARQ